MLKLLANAIEATSLAVLRFDKLESNDFKGEFVLGIVKALNLSLKRAVKLIEEPHPYEHCTEPFPEDTIDRIRQCVILLDVDQWYTGLNKWLNRSVPVPIGLPTVFDHFNLQAGMHSSSLRDLSDVLGKLEQHIKHQFLKKSITPHTEERRSLACVSESSASSAQRAAVKNPLANLANRAISADLGDAAASIFSELSEQNNISETISVDEEYMNSDETQPPLTVTDVVISIEESPTRAEPNATLHVSSTPCVRVASIAEISSGESGRVLDSSSKVISVPGIGLDLSYPHSTDLSSTSTSETRSNLSIERNDFEIKMSTNIEKFQIKYDVYLIILAIKMGFKTIET